MATAEEEILKILQSWGPKVVSLLKGAGYFQLPSDTPADEIAIKAGLKPGSRLYRDVVRASKAKNAQVWEQVFPAISEKGLRKGAEKTAKMLNVPVSAYDWNPLAQRYYDAHGDLFIKTMSLTDISSLHQQIQANFNLNPKTFGERFSESYSCSPSRLERIKRTEYHSSTQGGGWEFANEAGAKYKQWMCTPRDRWPRPEHRAIWYEVVPIDEPFSNGLMIPSDINCRCYLLYFFTDPSERKGRSETRYSGGEFRVLGSDKAKAEQAAFEEASE